MLLKPRATSQEVEFERPSKFISTIGYDDTMAIQHTVFLR